MAIGRISGPLLKANLLRDGIDLAFETDLLYLDVTNLRVGIRNDSPQHELDVNGTTRTTNLTVTDLLEVGPDGAPVISITGNTITSNAGILNLVSDEFVVYQSKLKVDDIDIDDNVISTNASNINLELRPAGTGTVEVFADTNVYGNMHVTGNIRVDGTAPNGSIQIGDDDTDNVTFVADIASNIIPDEDDTYTLGSSGKRWKDMWVNTLYANVIDTGDAIIDNININLRQGNIYYVASNGSDTYSGTHQNDPYATVKFALSQAEAGDTIFIYPGTYTEIFPMTVPVGVAVRGMGIRSVKIVPTLLTNSNDAFLLNGETTIEDLTIADFFYDSVANTGHAFRFASGFTVTSRSPYIRNITVLTKGSVTTVEDPLGFDQGDAGRGAWLDGSVATSSSKEAACLFHSVTFICPGVDAITATNGVRIEWLNSFTYYADRSMYAVSGSTGLASDGKTRVKITNTTGTWAVGNTITYYDVDGSTVLASGVVESIDGDYYVIDGKSLGWETLGDRVGKTAAVAGDAKLTTAEKKFGTASLALDGTGDYISYASQPDFAYGTGTFTIEMWIYRTVSGVTQVLLDQRTANPTNYAPVVFINTSNALQYNDGAASVITGATTVPLNVWSHVAVSRSGTSTRLFLNGVQQGSTYTDTRNYIATPVTIGSRFNNTQNFTGYIDEVRITKGLARYTANFTAPTAAFTSDTSTVLLLHFNGLNASTAIVDDGNTTQDLRSSAGGIASLIDFANYTDFGAEIRCIASAAVYGNYGIYGDGDGVIAYLIGQNLAYIGNAGASDNDPTTVIQANEIVELNRAKIYYSSVDHKGDFRVGDLFYVNQQTGEVSFSNSDVSFGNSLTFSDGLGNVTFIDASRIETGDFRISGNTVETLTQDFNVVAASNQINLQNNVNISGNLDVAGNVTIGGNITIGDETTDTISFVAGVDSNIVPNIDNTYSLGTLSQQWRNLFTQRLDIASIAIDGNQITTTESNADLELLASGTGRIYIPSNDVEIEQDLTVNGITNLLDTNITGTVTHVGNTNQTGNITQTGDISLTGNLTVSGFGQYADIRVDGNVLSTTLPNSDLELAASGTGRIYIPNNDVEIEQDLTVNGFIYVEDLTVATTITANKFTTGDISIEDNSITTTQSNSDLELLASGSGRIYIPSNDVEIEQDLTVNGITNLLDTNITGTVTHIGDLIQTGNIQLTGNHSLTGTLTVDDDAQFEDILISGNKITTTQSSSDLELAASGTGRIYIPNNDVQLDQTLTVDGLTTTSNINNTDTITSDKFTTGNILIDDNVITTTLSNSNLLLSANGTGIISVPSNDVEIEQDLTVNGITNLLDTNITGTVTHIGNTTQTGDVEQLGDYNLTGNLTVSNSAQFEDILIDGNVITTTIGNNDLILQASAAGIVLIPNNDVQLDQTLTVVGLTTTSNINNTDTITSDKFTTGNILIDDNVITTTLSNSNLELTANGTGIISVPSNDVEIEQDLTVNGITNLLDTNITGVITHVGDTTQTGNVEQLGDYNLTGNLTVSNSAQFEDILIDGNVITTTIDNNDLILQASAAGIVLIPNNDVQLDQTLTVVGLTTTSNINNTDTITSNIFTNGNIRITGNTVSTTQSNSNLQLLANGTGYIEIEQFEVQENEIRTSTNNNITLQPNGTGIVTVNSNQSIKLPVGATADRPSSATAGMIRFNTSLSRYEGFDGTNWIRLDGLYDLDENTYVTAELTPGANDNTFRFVSNGVQVADLSPTRLNVNSITVDDISINNNVIATTTSNTDLLLQTTGTGSIRLGNFTVRGSLITNTVANSITTINSTGAGYFKIAGTNGFSIPSGTTEQRPGQLEIGLTRFNTSDGRLEIYDGIQWISAAGASGGITAGDAEDIAILAALMLG